MQTAERVDVARDATTTPVVPEPAEGTSRRALLTGLGLVAGAAGLTSIAGHEAREVTPPSGPPSLLPRKVYGADWRIVRPGVAPGTMPPIGAPSLPHGRLVDSGGIDLGRFEASVMPTSGNGINLHQLVFFDGSITAVGPATFDDATFAVIGGTGTYAGVSGTYNLHQEPAPSGGTALFTLDIKTPEA
jgi:hypothetical protein